MRPAAWIAAATALAAAYIFLMQKQSASSANSQSDPAQEPTFYEAAMSSVQNSMTDPASDVGDANLQAFLTLIRTGEGTLGPNGYRRMFGANRYFDDFSQHPNAPYTANGLTSTAAGAYQFLKSTWDEMRAQYNLPDFSPASQDIAAAGLIKRRGAMADVLAGRFTIAINKCNKEWASLPGSPYGQPTLTYNKAALVLASAGGVTAA